MIAEPATTALTLGRALLGDPARFVSLTPVQRQASELYDMGFSIGPARPATKLPYIWRRLYTTRIDPAAIPDLFPGRAGLFVVTGAISRNLAILDCESQETARQHAAEFTRRGLRPWVVTTARGAHFWFLSADGELTNLKDDPAQPRGWELRGRCCYAMCPPSIHPTGVIYDWHYRAGELPPSIPLAALDWLGAELHTKAHRKAQPQEPEEYPELSRANREFILTGAAPGARNNRLFAAACDLAANGYSRADTRAALLPAARRCGLSERETNATIDSAYREARTPAKQTKAAPPVPAWAGARAWADAYPFTTLSAERYGRALRVSAATARAVFIALCERARREHPSTVFRASVREVAELAHLRAATVQAALNCLLAVGHLKACGHNTAGAGLFAFDAELLHNRNSNPPWSLVRQC